MVYFTVLTRKYENTNQVDLKSVCQFLWIRFTEMGDEPDYVSFAITFVVNFCINWVVL